MENKPFMPYVYRVTNKITGQFYIGEKIASGEIGVDYFTSSSNEAFREDFKARPENYLCEKLFESENIQEVAEMETKLIVEEKDNPQILNRATWGNSKVSVFYRDENFRSRISESVKKHWNNLPEDEKRWRVQRMQSNSHSPETQSKRTASLRGNSRCGDGMRGKSWTQFKWGEERKLQASEKLKGHRGHSWTEEEKKNMSKAKKGTRPKISEEMQKHLSEVRRKLVWWTDGTTNKRAISCPGPNFEKGRVFPYKGVLRG